MNLILFLAGWPWPLSYAIQIWCLFCSSMGIKVSWAYPFSPRAYKNFLMARQKFEKMHRKWNDKDMVHWPILWAHTEPKISLNYISLTINSFPTSGDLCCLLINFANSLDPDQAWQKVGPDLDPNCFTLWWYSWKIFLKRLIKKKKDIKKACKITQHAKSFWTCIC